MDTKRNQNITIVEYHKSICPACPLPPPAANQPVRTRRGSDAVRDVSETKEELEEKKGAENVEGRCGEKMWMRRQIRRQREGLREIKRRARADKEEDEEDEIKSWARLALRREEDVLTLSARV